MKPAEKWLIDIHSDKYFGKGMQVVIEDIQRDALEAAAKSKPHMHGFSDIAQAACNRWERSIHALMPPVQQEEKK